MPKKKKKKLANNTDLTAKISEISLVISFLRYRPKSLPSPMIREGRILKKNSPYKKKYRNSIKIMEETRTGYKIKVKGKELVLTGIYERKLRNKQRKTI